MAKNYINADLFRKEVEKRIEETKSMKPSFDQFWAGQISAFKGVIKLIDSLQQEQCETDGDDGKFVKILVRKEFAEQIQRLGDKIQAGQSSFVEAMNQQEQPEVDLEKEIKDWCDENITGVRPIYTADSLIHYLLPKTARHFYELGQNSK